MVSEEVFLSYNHEDRTLAGKIKDQLETLGFTAFLAHEDIEVSAEWRAEIEKHLDSCSGLVAIVTENFTKSSWANQEVGVAIGKGKPVISLVFGASSVLQGFLESLQGIPTSENMIEDAVSKAIQVISEKKKEESPEEIERELREKRIEEAAMLYTFVLVEGMSLFAGWVLGQAFYGFLLGLALLFGIFVWGHFGGWKAAAVAEQCKKHSFRFLYGATCLLSISLAFWCSLHIYSFLSSITLHTYLVDLPIYSTEFYFSIVGVTILLHLPTAPKLNASSFLNLVHILKRNSRKLFLVCLVFIVVLSTLPLDTVLLIGVPKVSFTESRYLVDGQIHIAGPDVKNLESYVTNEETIHLLLPPIPLTRNFSIGFQSNSSRKPSVIEASGISHDLQFNASEKLAAIQLSMSSSGGQNAFLKLSYFSELNTSSVIRIEGWDGVPSVVQQFSNGTRQNKLVFNITNVSQHQLWFEVKIELPRVPSYHDGAPLYYKYDSRIEKCSANIETQDGLIYLPGGFWIQRGGFIEITVIYND